MIIRAITLRHFGRFDEARFDFSTGLNLVSGPNEAGKSTLMEAIPAVLFGVRDKERFRPWGREGSCHAYLDLDSSAGSRVRIEREILSDRVLLTEWATDGSTLLSFEGKVAPLGRSSEKAIYLQHLQRLVGQADETLFRASLFFSQGSLEVAAPDDVTARIKTILSGCAEIDYDQVLTSLCDDYFAITRENPWGKDKARDRELEEVRARLAELEQRWYAARSGQADVETLRRELAAVQARLDQARADLAEGRRYLDWVRRQWQLDEKETTLRRDFSRVQRASGKVDELQTELERLRHEFKVIGLPRELPEQLPQLLAEGQGLRKELIALQESVMQLRTARAAIPPAPWRSALAGSVLLGALTAGVVLNREQVTPVLVLGGAALALVWGLFLRRYLRLNAERAALDGQFEQIAARRHAAKNALAELEGAFTGLGLPASAVEMVRMEKNLDRHRQLVLRIKELESALAVLEEPAEIATERETLTRELAVLAERREQDGPSRSTSLPQPAELPAMEATLAQLAEQIATDEARLFELTRREAQAQGETADPVQIEEEGEGLREREAVLLRRRDALATACNLLRETVDDFRRTYVERFADDIGHYLALLTRLRYECIRLDDDFAPQVQIPGRDWQPVTRLSRGAQDAVFFSVRLALTRHLTRGRHLPLLLDDPFVHLDRQRLQEALRLLERIAPEHQILLFSHDDALLRKAERDNWRVVFLDQREVRSNGGTKPKEKTQDDGQQLSFL